MLRSAAARTSASSLRRCLSSSVSSMAAAVATPHTADPLAVHNWAKNQTFSPSAVHHPRSLEELCKLVASSPKCKVVGSLHSFNASAEATNADMIFLDRLPLFCEIDEQARTVRVPSGMKYGELVSALGPAWSLENLASLPHISVGGSIASATHGSGVRNGNLATSVVGMEMVLADGSLLSMKQGDADFEGYPVHIGALGAVTAVTLRLVPAFQIRQDLYENLPLRTAVENFDAIMSAGYSVSLFTTWGPSNSFEQVWRKSLPSDCPADGRMPREWFGATLATLPLHPIPGVPGEECSAQLGSVGPSNQRLAHFRMEFCPSFGLELQSEYFISRADAPAALKAVSALGPRISPLLHVSEVRCIAPDALWLSPAHGRDTVALHFTWKAMGDRVAGLLPELEAALAPFGAVPHWGKLCAPGGAAAARLRGLGEGAVFPRLPDFLRLRRRIDPSGKFVNAYVEGLLGPL